MIPLKQRLEDPKLKKRLKKTIVTLLVTLSVLGAAGVFVGFFYEDTVKRIIITELNKRLNTEIVVQDVENDIQFSIFRKFPYASVSFSNVKVMDAIKTQKPKGILLEASSLSLQFSILDILFGRYKIKKIEAEEGNVSIKIYKNRSDNYHFWKPSADTSASDFALDLQKIALDDMGLSYVDYGRKQDYKVFARDVILKGKFSDTEYTLNIDGRVFVYLIKLEQDIYLANQPADLDVILYVNSGNDYVTFKEGGIDIGKLVFDITGTINYAESNTLLDLRVEGKKMKIQSLINQLPSRYRELLGDYEFKGDFNFIALVKGYTGEKTNPLVSVAFGLKDGDIIQKQNSITLSHVCFDAEFTNGSGHQKATTTLSVRGFKSQLNDGNIAGSIQIKNFIKPEIALKLAASLDLKDIFLFVKTDTVQSASGKILLNTDIKGVIERPDGFTVRDFIASTSTGTLEVQDAGIELKGGRHNFSGLNGLFTFSNNDIETGQFSGKYMATDFTMRGKFKNIIPYLFIENQSLLIDAGFHSDFIDLGEILEYSSGKKDTVYRMEMPENVDFSLGIDIGKLTFKKFTATNITGKVTMKDKQFVAHDISLKAMNGNIIFSGLVDGAAPDKLLISCDASIKKVDIRRLFGELENFGQTSLQERNLKGQLSATLQFASVWSSTFKVEKPTIYAKADIVIENGALIDYEPLSGLSKYLKGRDLKNVSFETMKNTIEIKNEVIQIPTMEINSNAIDFQVNGTHGFDQKIDYHLSVLLSDLGTVKEKNMQAEDIGVITDDGLHNERYFFRITGTVDEPVYHTIDKEGYKANIKTNLAKEKESLKEILNREFGWFKKDTVITKEKGQKPKEKYEFNVVWDEDEDSNKKEVE
ncbi:MAG TPA: AsmA-like C-terminal region-containing protein [Bacteroidales bacterium]|nr:AsmA-like C-terminal region-containing protein [Bacteroidales bacterium]HPB24882.1 AsmA-like C-terminal region-containing protein [Bacteroidales bacterium]HPI29773.1 AsmA-like C-terminal region-containing protein [Bacteroidales bacterium]HQN15254.1 AsmA-like C-terminal region-containing protein [Bacteroidales bacterium]HQP14588.1 AsmA-like C-terminal region-containing protein [Bacteroidales bacterium]